MQNTTNTIETIIAAAPLVEPGKTQYTLGSSYKSKCDIVALCQEFTRPGSSNKEVKMSEKEALEILFKIATDKRFYQVPVMEEIEIDGKKIELQVHDTDGQLMFATNDLIEEEWETIKARDYAESAKGSVKTIEDLESQLRKYGKALNLSEDTIKAMIASAKANS